MDPATCARKMAEGVDRWIEGSHPDVVTEERWKEIMRVFKSEFGIKQAQTTQNGEKKMTETRQSQTYAVGMDNYSLGLRVSGSRQP